MVVATQVDNRRTFSVNFNFERWFFATSLAAEAKILNHETFLVVRIPISLAVQQENREI